MLKTKFNSWRWLGFFLAFVGAYVLGSAQTNSQWLGWFICCLSCIIWIFMALKDKDVPRAMMEIMYLFLGIRAIYYWYV